MTVIPLAFKIGVDEPSNLSRLAEGPYVLVRRVAYRIRPDAAKAASSRLRSPRRAGLTEAVEGLPKIALQLLYRTNGSAKVYFSAHNSFV